MADKRYALRLIVDTNVARSAGETINPTSVNCRACLDTIRDFEYRVVITPDVLEEWKKHRSSYFRRWLVSMFARKLDYQIESNTTNSALRGKIVKFASNEKDETEMLKDAHLLEGALLTDKRIISMETNSRNRFKILAKNAAEIRFIMWVNPDPKEEDKAIEKCIEWLQDGAPDEEGRTLGYIQPDAT